MSPTSYKEIPQAVAARWNPFLEQCQQLAQQAALQGEVPVGALVLDPDLKIIARAFNQRESIPDPSAHAEILALRKAAQALNKSHLDGCTLVVNLEPCTMCAGAIQLARIKTVVFGAFEPKTGAAGSVRDVLRDERANHTVEVIGALAQQRCAQQLAEFFANKR